MAAKYFPQSWLFVDAFLLCAHNHLRECFLARVAALYVALTWCRVPHVGRTKRSSRGFDVASCTILTHSPKTTIFPHNCPASPGRDPLFCPAARVSCNFLSDPSAPGKISGGELLNWTLADNQMQKNSIPRTCILDLFLFARFISISLSWNRPSLTQGRRLRVFSCCNCERPQLSISNVEPISHIWHGFSANQNVCAVEKPAQGSARLY